MGRRVGLKCWLKIDPPARLMNEIKKCLKISNDPFLENENFPQNGVWCSFIRDPGPRSGGGAPLDLSAFGPTMVGAEGQKI